MSALEGRRGYAQIAALDALDESEDAALAVRVAIETATRVRITPDIIAVATESDSGERGPSMTMRERLERAFRAAGFEVKP